MIVSFMFISESIVTLVQTAQATGGNRYCIRDVDHKCVLVRRFARQKTEDRGEEREQTTTEQNRSRETKAIIIRLLLPNLSVS